MFYDIIFLQLVYLYYCIQYTIFKMRTFEAFCEMNDLDLIFNTSIVFIVSPVFAPIDSIIELFYWVKE